MLTPFFPSIEQILERDRTIDQLKNSAYKMESEIGSLKDQLSKSQVGFGPYILESRDLFGARD